MGVGSHRKHVALMYSALSEITSQCDRLSKCKTLHDEHDGITIKEIKFSYIYSHVSQRVYMNIHVHVHLYA